MKFEKNWQEFGGRLVPRQVLDSLVTHPQHIPSRLKVGMKVRVGLNGINTPEAQFLTAIVTDVVYSEQGGWSWDLALPVGNGDFYAVVKGFPEAGFSSTVPDEIGAYSSGIFTEEEFELYLDSLRETAKKEDRPTFTVVK